MSNVPHAFLTPAMVFIGIMSSLASDAGYVVLPPLAAAIYLAAGRSPLVGIAAVFAGVSAGFNANLLITSLEPLMSELSQDAAQNVDPNREVAATSNWYFLAVSTFVITGAGWLTTALFVERRLEQKPPEDGGPDHAAAKAEAAKGDLEPREKAAAITSVVAFFLVLLAVGVLTTIDGSPLAGQDGSFPRWVAAIVPLLFISFVLPGVTYGVMVKDIRSTKDVAKRMIDSMAGMAPIIVLAFFAGQFIAYFSESNLGSMLAFAGGEWLFYQGLGAIPLVLAFIVLTMVFNMFVGSMSAKYTLFAPIFVPMFMLIGIRPELTQVAYRIGDSVTNIITPLNAYLVIILVFMQKYAKNAGMGTLIAMMLPYTVVFSIVWSIMLVVWMLLDVPLGPGDLMQPMTEGFAPGGGAESAAAAAAADGSTS
jgi:aminobenzoyl-glutamate transport protein